jgi:CRISPR-associated protein Cas1
MRRGEIGGGHRAQRDESDGRWKLRGGGRAFVSFEDGLALQMRKGSLCIRESDGTETLYPARIHRLKTILLAGHGASITTEAMRWCAREAVALYLMERSGECLTLLMDATECDARRSALTIRQRQFKAVLSQPKRLEIARKIVTMKLRTLKLAADEARAPGVSNWTPAPRSGKERADNESRATKVREFREEIKSADSIESLLVAEARAGAAYFMRWRRFELQFKGDAPEYWQVFMARATGLIKGRGGTSKARHAASPMGAMLNYAFMVALGQCTRAVIGAGLDACHGFLHSPKPGRLSLSYDVLEFHRATITEAVFRFAGKRVFKRDDFELDERGVVRLGGPIAREIATLALKVTPITEAAKSVRRVIGWL